MIEDMLTKILNGFTYEELQELIQRAKVISIQKLEERIKM